MRKRQRILWAPSCKFSVHKDYVVTAWSLLWTQHRDNDEHMSLFLINECVYDVLKKNLFLILRMCIGASWTSKNKDRKPVLCQFSRWFIYTWTIQRYKIAYPVNLFFFCHKQYQNKRVWYTGTTTWRKLHGYALILFF